ncbi:hypothetical protein Tco_0255140 [Tanacetum coccineum]
MSGSYAANIGLFGLKKKIEKLEEEAVEIMKEGLESSEKGVEAIERGEKEIQSEVSFELGSGGGLMQAGVVAGVVVVGGLVATSVVNRILGPGKTKFGSLQEAKTKNVFQGVKVGSNSVDISNLQFADDALIMGKWSLDNAKNLCRILRCFYMASGLKVNFSKSKFFGIGVSNTDINTFASALCSQPSSFPCSYLGLPIGANMNKSSNWNAIIEKFHKPPGAVIKYLDKLRRNFFWGGDIESNKMTWISWKMVCSPSTCGGLSVGSLQAMNLAMLTKWVWRFHTESHSLWHQIITSIHDPSGAFGSTVRQLVSPWWPISNLNNSLSSVGIDLNSLFTRKVGTGSSIAFWHDNWIGPSDLKSLYPRLFALETNKECRISDRCFTLNGLTHHVWAWRRVVRDGHKMDQLRDLLGLINNFCPSNSPDSWAFTLSTQKSFTVASMRREIENTFCVIILSDTVNLIDTAKTCFDVVVYTTTCFGGFKDLINNETSPPIYSLSDKTPSPKAHNVVNRIKSLSRNNGENKSPPPKVNSGGGDGSCCLNHLFCGQL